MKWAVVAVVAAMCVTFIGGVAVGYHLHGYFEGFPVVRVVVDGIDYDTMRVSSKNGDVLEYSQESKQMIREIDVVDFVYDDLFNVDGLQL